MYDQVYKADTTLNKAIKIRKEAQKILEEAQELYIKPSKSQKTIDNKWKTNSIKKPTKK